MNSIEVTKNGLLVRNPTEKDFDGIIDICKRVYPFSPPWKKEQLKSHLEIFPEGQLVAVEKSKVLGYAASLVVNWEDYELEDPWRDFTEGGYFTNHDLAFGKTLYGAEVMVDPDARGRGVGKLLYEARRQIVRHFRLLRIRAGARLRGYATYKEQYDVEEYIWHVMNLKIFDPTVSFQIKQGFKVLNLIPDYLRHDPESLGYAVLIEWLNSEEASDERFEKQNRYYKKLQKIYQPGHD